MINQSSAPQGGPPCFTRLNVLVNANCLCRLATSTRSSFMELMHPMSQGVGTIRHHADTHLEIRVKLHKAKALATPGELQYTVDSQSFKLNYQHVHTSCLTGNLTPPLCVILLPNETQLCNTTKRLLRPLQRHHNVLLSLPLGSRWRCSRRGVAFGCRHASRGPARPPRAGLRSTAAPGAHSPGLGRRCHTCGRSSRVRLRRLRRGRSRRSLARLNAVHEGWRAGRGGRWRLGRWGLWRSCSRLFLGRWGRAGIGSRLICRCWGGQGQLLRRRSCRGLRLAFRLHRRHRSRQAWGLQGAWLRRLFHDRDCDGRCDRLKLYHRIKGRQWHWYLWRGCRHGVAGRRRRRKRLRLLHRGRQRRCGRCGCGSRRCRHRHHRKTIGRPVRRRRHRRRSTCGSCATSGHCRGSRWRQMLLFQLCGLRLLLQLHSLWRHLLRLRCLCRLLQLGWRLQLRWLRLLLGRRKSRAGVWQRQQGWGRHCGQRWCCPRGSCCHRRAGRHAWRRHARAAALLPQHRTRGHPCNERQSHCVCKKTITQSARRSLKLGDTGCSIMPS